MASGGQVAGIACSSRPGHQEIRCQAGEEPLQSHPAPFQQDVDVPGLRQSLRGGRRLGEVVALQQGDLLEVVGQDRAASIPAMLPPTTTAWRRGMALAVRSVEPSVASIASSSVSNGVSQDLRDRIVIHAPLVDYDSGFREQRSKIQRSAVQFTGQRKVAAGPEARRASYHDGAFPLPAVTAASARPDPERPADACDEVRRVGVEHRGVPRLRVVEVPGPAPPSSRVLGRRRGRREFAPG